MNNSKGFEIFMNTTALSIRNVLIDLSEGIKKEKYKNDNDLRINVAMRIMPRHYYDLLKQQQQMKQLQKQKKEMTDEKRDEKFMSLIKRLDGLDQKPSNIKIINKRNEINDQLVDIRLEINKMEELINKKKSTMDRIDLGEDTQLQLEQDNDDKRRK